jgi:SAM-dependent methyltransferase
VDWFSEGSSSLPITDVPAGIVSGISCAAIGAIAGAADELSFDLSSGICAGGTDELSVGCSPAAGACTGWWLWSLSAGAPSGRC